MHRWFAWWVLVLAACGFPRPPDVAECTTARDCTSPGAPLCASGTCVAACQRDADCDGAPGGRLCQTSTGACVGCRDASDCPAALPICDGVDHRCRSCVRDDDCPGGICLEPEARCVADASVVFVDGGGLSSGTCSRQAPCSFAFGLTQVGGDRSNLKIYPGSVMLSAPAMLRGDINIDGTDSVITGPAGMFQLSARSNISLSHLRLEPSSGPVATIGVLQIIRLYDVQTTGALQIDGGGLDVDRSTFTHAGGVACMSGTVTIRRSRFVDSELSAINCQIVARRTRFDLSGDINKIGFNNGVVTFENNLITQTLGHADSMALVNVAPTSTVQFNTFVNTAPLPSDGVALSCASPVNASSNVFAYQSMHPLTCGVRYSLIDEVAVTNAPGVGNKTAAGGSFFVDRNGGDFHLSTSSPARGAAEVGLGVPDDFDGNARPLPVGAAPDIGAFEAN